MKTPFPALYIHRSPAPVSSCCVMPCMVETLFPESQNALVKIKTPGTRYECAKLISFDHLASTREIAAAKVAQALGHVLEFLPASAEKSAATAEVAGDRTEAGVLSP